MAELDAAIEHEQSALDAQTSNLVEAQKKASLAAEQADRGRSPHPDAPFDIVVVRDQPKP